MQIKLLNIYSVFFIIVAINAAKIPKDHRIIGGQEARAGQFPWQAAIYSETSQGTFFCGGALVSNQFVVTAAQCIYKAVRFTVILGTNHLQATDVNRLVVSTSDYILHPDYNPLTLEHDVGLIKFHIPITFNDYIKPINVANMGQIQQGVNVTASGWGQVNDEDGQLSNALNFVTLSVISNDDCKINYGTQIKDGMVCAIGNYNEGICLGDTGSPLIKLGIKGEPLHVGVASFMSQNGCETPEPTGYTRTDIYHDWIWKIIMPN